MTQIFSDYAKNTPHMVTHQQKLIWLVYHQIKFENNWSNQDVLNETGIPQNRCSMYMQGKINFTWDNQLLFMYHFMRYKGIDARKESPHEYLKNLSSQDISQRFLHFMQDTGRVTHSRGDQSSLVNRLLRWYDECVEFDSNPEVEKKKEINALKKFKETL